MLRLSSFQPFISAVKGAEIAKVDASQARKEALSAMEAIHTLRVRIRERIKTEAQNTSKNGALQELERIKAIKEIASIAVGNEGIEIYTTPLIAIDPSSNKQYDMGCYKIFLPRWNKKIEVTIRNLTRQIDNMHHPHVRGQDSICWGNLNEILITLFEQRQLAMAITMIIAFLKTCNPDDNWGKDIKKWPLVS